MKKDVNGFIDPAVASILGDGERVREDRSLSRGERAKRNKAAARQEERKGRRAVYDIDPEVIKAVQELARDLGTTASSVAGILLHYGLQAFDEEKLDLTCYMKQLERNPRYEYELVWKESEK